MSVSVGPAYYVLDGVRRSVAAYRAGLKVIPATVRQPGTRPVQSRLPLDSLHSPKQQILRDLRYIRNTEYPTELLKTEPPPIEVELLGLPGQLPTVPVSQVQLI